MANDRWCLLLLFFFFHSFLKFYFWSTLVRWRAKNPKIFLRLLSNDWTLRCVFICSMNIYWAPTILQVLTTCACVLSCFSCAQLFATLWMEPTRLLYPWGFSKQEYWSGLPCPSPGLTTQLFTKQIPWHPEPCVQLCNYLSGSAILLIWSKSNVV